MAILNWHEDDAGNRHYTIIFSAEEVAKVHLWETKSRNNRNILERPVFSEGELDLMSFAKDEDAPMSYKIMALSVALNKLEAADVDPTEFFGSATWQ